MVNAISITNPANQATSPPSPGELPDLPAIYAECRAMLDALSNGNQVSLSVGHRISSYGTFFEAGVVHEALRYVTPHAAEVVDVTDHNRLVARFREKVVPAVERAMRIQATVDAVK